MKKKLFNKFLVEKFSENELNVIRDGHFGNQVAIPEAFQPEYKFYVYCVKLLKKFRSANNLPTPDYFFTKEVQIPELYD